LFLSSFDSVEQKLVKNTPLPARASGADNLHHPENNGKRGSKNYRELLFLSRIFRRLLTPFSLNSVSFGKPLLGCSHWSNTEAFGG
jgi:hypothetical protein